MVMTTSGEDTQVRQQARARRLAGASRGTQVAQRREAWPGQPAAIYCRISHVKDQDQTGVDRQERICREIAARHGFTVAAEQVFVDNNRSAWRRDRRRDGWDAMLAEPRQGSVRHLLAYHPDRLMRQPRDLEELLTIADETGITLHGRPTSGTCPTRTTGSCCGSRSRTPAVPPTTPPAG
jgi:site-specific DNA recombinase